MCPDKIIKVFWLKIFFLFNMDLGISPRIFEKFETVQRGYSGAGVKLIDAKNHLQKSRDTVPLK
jgi:hypothetical protein